MRSLFFWSELLSLLFMTWVLTLSFPHENVKKNNLRFIFFHERNSVNSFFHNFSCVKMRWKIPRDFSISETELFIFNFFFFNFQESEIFSVENKKQKNKNKIKKYFLQDTCFFICECVLHCVYCCNTYFDHKRLTCTTI